MNRIRIDFELKKGLFYPSLRLCESLFHYFHLPEIEKRVIPQFPKYLIMGQYYGEMLAETGSFDVLFWYWVLGIGVYTYIHMM